MKIYTKGGDRGITSLVGGTRISKGDLRIDLYGEVDELNAFIGNCLVLDDFFKESDIKLLMQIQHTLFDLGALMACEANKREQFKLKNISSSFVEQLEEAIDNIESEVGPLKKFIMPRGSECIVRLHLARVVTRRVERKLVVFENQFPEEAIEHAVKMINRLSDYLFMLVRDQLFRYEITTEEYK